MLLSILNHADRTPHKCVEIKFMYVIDGNNNFLLLFSQIAYIFTRNKTVAILRIFTVIT